MSEVLKRQKEVVEEFAEFFDWEERFEYLCDLGKKSLKDFPDDQRRDEFLVKGCTSKVWLVPSFEAGRIYLKADSDSIFVKGLVALVVRVYSGQEAQDILDHPADFLKEAGLMQNLTPNRANGLASMIEVLRSYAESYRQSQGS